MNRTICLGILVMTVGCASPSTPQRPVDAGIHLSFEARPCFHEVHLGLSDISIVDRDGNLVPDAQFREPPAVFIRDGARESELGNFCEGCGGSLRIHVPLPATKSGTPVIVVRGTLKDGSSVTGTQTINPADFD